MSNQDLLLERLDRLEAKLDRVAAMEEQYKTFAGAWENLSDLGRDMSLLIEPAVKRMTEELAEVETGFQLEDAFFLLRRFLLSLRHLTWSLEQLENLIDWWDDVEPILKITVPRLIVKLDYLEEAGVFRLLHKLVSLEMLRFVDRLSNVPMEARLAQVKPVGPLGLLWKMRSKECRQGLGVMLELTRALGKLGEEAPAAAPES